VVEGSSTPLFRYDPTVMNHLMVSTSALSQFITNKGVENGRQNLDGMSFQMEPPAGGQPVSEFVNWWSGAIYNRWQYDPALGKYLRFQETETDTTGGQNTQYAQMTDRLTGEPLAFDNVVVIQVLYQYYDVEVYDPLLIGSGKAYAFRDGQMYEVQWQRPASDSVISLAYPDGTPFPFKPGNTWFEVMGQASTVATTEQGMWFKHLMP